MQCFVPIIFVNIKLKKLKDSNNYLNINKKAWNIKTSMHINSEFYDLPSFKKGENTLKNAELELLGDMYGKTVLHLQCHFGQDTMSLSRMGAKATGVDFSEEAISSARKLAEELNLNTEFVLADIYDLPIHLQGQFDVVFTSYGVVGWLPDMDKWANIIHKFLKPGGTFVMVELHPAVWMFDNDFEKITYSYFNETQIIETEKGSYADRNDATEITTITWNHSLAEVMSSLLNQGLQIQTFNEYAYSSYHCLNRMIEDSPGKFILEPFGNKLPMMYAIKAIKPS